MSVLYRTTELVARFKGERDDFLKQHKTVQGDSAPSTHIATSRRQSEKSSSPRRVFTA